jgi:adenylate cyclase
MLLAQSHERSQGVELTDTNAWRGKLVIVGSAVAGGNDLTDRGATPLAADTLLVSKHWNVANSVITGRFIRRLTLGEELGLIVILGILSGLLTWRLRALAATAAVGLLTAAFVAHCFVAYIQWRLWVPMILPAGGSVLLTWACLTAWRAVFEQAEQRRVKSVFSRIVSPNVVNELLRAEKLSLGGTRSEITVLFADVRGFTEFTDASQEQAAQHILAAGLSGAEAAAYVDEQARGTLNTVNQYLAGVADAVKNHDGTLDKYIGDCVMAFWGAPTPNPKHAVACVRAAIDAQRAVAKLNQQREEENMRIDAENMKCVATGRPIKPLLPVLALGTGINTGLATVGLMGSDAHILNYTVFGREVNLASRLEGVSGRSRIVIGEGTYQHIRRDDSKLAAVCVELPRVEVKGIREALRVYEVLWREIEG